MIDSLVLPSKKIKDNSLLIIRIDAIGDYVLFRNFIEKLKRSNKYRHYNISLLGNISWKNLAEELDKKYITNFIWLERNKFFNNFFYRYRILKEITITGYDIVINPVYSREFFFTESIVKKIYSREKIGYDGDLSNLSQRQKKISNKYYTILIPAKDGIQFEFYRNKEFFEILFEEGIDIAKPSIKIKMNNLSSHLPVNYAILFIGSSSKSRKWKVENFIEIGKYLKNNFQFNIVLCGSQNDFIDAQTFSDLADYKYLNLVGKTSLIELSILINNCEILISNETSAPHIAVAVNLKNIFVVSNGNHFGRFTPYPKKITDKYHVIFPPLIEKDLFDIDSLIGKYGASSSLNINGITVERMKEELNKVFLYKL